MVALHSVDGAQEWQPSPLSRWQLGLGNKVCGIVWCNAPRGGTSSVKGSGKGGVKVQPSSNKEEAELPRMGGRRALSAPNSHSTALSSHHHNVIVEHFPKTIKKNDRAPHFSLLPSHTLKHCYC